MAGEQQCFEDHKGEERLRCVRCRVDDSEIVIGTTSGGTLGNYDLINSFMAVLKRLDERAVDRIVEEFEKDLPGNYDGNTGELTGEAKAELVDTLLGALDELAPEGVYFGAHEGDGADFGFWYISDFQEMGDGGPSDQELYEDRYGRGGPTRDYGITLALGFELINGSMGTP